MSKHNITTRVAKAIADFSDDDLMNAYASTYVERALWLAGVLLAVGVLWILTAVNAGVLSYAVVTVFLLYALGKLTVVHFAYNAVKRVLSQRQRD